MPPVSGRSYARRQLGGSTEVLGSSHSLCFCRCLLAWAKETLASLSVECQDARYYFNDEVDGAALRRREFVVLVQLFFSYWLFVSVPA